MVDIQNDSTLEEIAVKPTQDSGGVGVAGSNPVAPTARNP